METRFDRDTALRRLDGMRFEGRMDRGWWIIAGPNGGYVAAVVLRAMQLAVDDAARAPRSLTVHFVRPPAEGPVTVDVTIERSGRTLTTVTARMLQGEKLMALAIGAFGIDREGFTFDDVSMPKFPPPSDCPLVREHLGSVVELQHRYAHRWATEALPFSGAERAVVGAWLQLDEPRVADALLVAAFTDALPPPAMVRASPGQATGPLPTIDLTIHFRHSLPLSNASPDDAYAALFESRVAAGGYVEEDGHIWSPDGRLVAQSRQLSVIT